ncbi:unnamed protein product [Rotaria sp. Silwood1]|nr:unnamed protein product [Rotaria sp. Silwood1]CAF1194530.1 unnamed protein product [Rotaria sp. Silwood1]CAF3456275.1 unnamed protein product [Rotaria sp. Silwood1]CAF4706779.1 unnamed protein product [Rotaria sp. Silwood1]
MVIVLYTMLESIHTDRDEQKKLKEQWINQRLDSLEDSIQDLDKEIKYARQKQNEKLTSTQQSKLLFENLTEKTVSQLTDNKTQTILFKSNNSNNQCIWRTSSPMNTTFDTRQLYDSLPFDNPDGGVWIQGFDIQYNASQWTSNNKLKIILMPHSHCDPGWLATYEQYFFHVVRPIINVMLGKLSENSKYKFVWAEMSFLSLWWNHAKNDQRELLKKFLNNKQLEIVTGGWVMNDEANTHYFSMLDQLIEGHQFIENTFGNITVQSSWANDPFGYSPTMAYLLQGSGIHYMAIQRIHYHIKKALAKTKQLEFLWQQTWDRTVSTRIFTHVLPFYGYDIPHTCGPDPKICCQFDFRRGVNSFTGCSWGINPVFINDSNTHERAELLLDQYRKKAQLYRTNVLFIPLGDDFRYRLKYEAKLQFDNYDKLFTYMNQRTDWNVQIQYGTLSDYFEQILQEKSLTEFPSYAGDFFTYADRADNYWSGYYTSRAFFKRMNRIAESYLRATEILFSLAHAQVLEGKIVSYFPKDDLFTKLIIARQNLGIFQHHDGITGTARDHVVDDFGQKLLTVIMLSQLIMQQSAAYLLFQNYYSVHEQFLLLNQEFQTFDILPIRKLISFQNKKQTIRTIYIYNPTDQRRIEIVKILLDTYHVRVTSNKEPIQTCQIDPKWSNRRSNIMNQNQFELLILIDIEPYSIKEYTIHATTTTQQSCPLTKIEYINEKQAPTLSKPFQISIIDRKKFQIENRFLSITFSKNGVLLNVQHKNFDEKIRFHTNMIRYGTLKESDHHSGAYLFIPDGTAQYISTSNYNFIRIQRGPLVSRVYLNHELYGLQYKLTNINGSNDNILEISTTMHLNMNKDTELALQFSTGIKNDVNFFTDLNGFQMIRRKTYDKLPLQGNVYPMPTMAYIEDDFMRLTILAGQPSGVACLKPGVIDVFLDRRLTRDDGRGLGQGVMDNREIISTFKLLFESRHTIADRTSLTGYPTLLAHHLSIELLYPIHLFHSLKSNIVLNKLNLFLKPSLLPSDYHLVNLRTLINNYDNNNTYSSLKNIALIIRRFAYDCDEYYDRSFHFEKPIFEHFFHVNQIQTIEQTSLSLRHIKQKLNITSKLDVPFAEIFTYKIRLN